MKRKTFVLFIIALIGFVFTLNFAGCKKKEEPKDAPGVEESTEDDIADEDESEESE